MAQPVRAPTHSDGPRGRELLRPGKRQGAWGGVAGIYSRGRWSGGLNEKIAALDGRAPENSGRLDGFDAARGRHGGEARPTDRPEERRRRIGCSATARVRGWSLATKPPKLTAPTSETARAVWALATKKEFNRAPAANWILGVRQRLR